MKTILLTIITIPSLLLSSNQAFQSDHNIETSTICEPNTKNKNYIPKYKFITRKWSSVSANTMPITLFKQLPVFPSFEFSLENFKTNYTSRRFDLELGLLSTGGEFGIGSAYYLPFTEAKVHRLMYWSPNNKISIYSGPGIGLSFPRLVPIYYTIGFLYKTTKIHAFKIELQTGISPLFLLFDSYLIINGAFFRFPLVTIATTSVKISTGVSF